LKTLNRAIHFFEDSLLIFLLVSLIILASGQIALRNFFEIGFIWLDPLLRVLVLWTGMIGATIASRDNKHIRIDLVSRFFSIRTRIALQVLVGLFTTFICSVIAWHGAKWVLIDYQDKLTGFANLPAWLLELIIPLAFGLIALRYLIHSFCWMGMCFNLPHQDSDQS